MPCRPDEGLALQVVRAWLHPGVPEVSALLLLAQEVCRAEAGWRLGSKPHGWFICRGKRSQNNKTSLIKITGVESKKEVEFYLGKRIAYIYKGKTKRKGSVYRVIWGKVTCPALAYLPIYTCALQPDPHTVSKPAQSKVWLTGHTGTRQHRCCACTVQETPPTHLLGGSPPLRPAGAVHAAERQQPAESWYLRFEARQAVLQS